jgi:hypothetical protein
MIQASFGAHPWAGLDGGRSTAWPNSTHIAAAPVTARMFFGRDDVHLIA